MRVLFVCTGNICRSPTAERLLRLHVSRLRVSGIEAASAGTRAVRGQPIDDGAAEQLRRLGADTGNFVARQLTPRIAADSDLIITMTVQHRNAVLEMAPRLLRRTFTLSEVVHLAEMDKGCTIDSLNDLRPRLRSQQLVDVSDPIGKDSEVFARVADEIVGSVPAVLELCRRSLPQSV